LALLMAGCDFSEPPRKREGQGNMPQSHEAPEAVAPTAPDGASTASSAESNEPVPQEGPRKLRPQMLMERPPMKAVRPSNVKVQPRLGSPVQLARPDGSQPIEAPDKATKADSQPEVEAPRESP